MLVLLGPSASGKTEIAKALAINYGMRKVITYTTRTPRLNEINGIDYNFVSAAEFIKLSDNGFFAETTVYNGCHYGTAKKDLQQNRVIIVDPVGLQSFIKIPGLKFVSIFLDAKEEIRYNRMISRKDDIEKAKKRLDNDRIAFAKSNLYDVDAIVKSDIMSINLLAAEIDTLYKKIYIKK